MRQFYFLVCLSLVIIIPSFVWAGSEAYTVGAACGTSASPATPAGASAPDWDTIMQCNGSTWQRASPFLAGSVAIGTTSLTSGTALDLGSNTNSMLLPVGTTGQRPGTGTPGMLRYNSSIAGVEAYNGVWSTLGGFSLSCTDLSANQEKIISSSSSLWAPFCLIGASSSFQNSNWTSASNASYTSAISTCLTYSAEICSAAELKQVYSTTAGSAGLSGLQLWTRDFGFLGEYQNGTSCQPGGGTCYPVEVEPYVFKNGAISVATQELENTQNGFFCCRH